MSIVANVTVGSIGKHCGTIRGHSIVLMNVAKHVQLGLDPSLNLLEKIATACSVASSTAVAMAKGWPMCH